MKRILVLMSALFILLGMSASPVVAKDLVIWEPQNEGLDGGIVQTMAIDPTNSDVLYAGTPAGIFKSIDSGQNWREINSGIKVYNIVKIVIDPSNVQTVYAASGGGGVYKSTNGGESWKAINQGLDKLDVRAIAIKPDESTVLLAGTEDALYKSTDSGQTWLKVQEAPQSSLPDYFGSAISFALGDMI